MASTVVPVSSGALHEYGFGRKEIGQHLGALATKSSSSELAVRAGVIWSDNNPLQYISNSGLTGQIQAGNALIPVADLGLGPVLFEVEADTLLTHPTANGTNPRIDSVILEVKDSSWFVDTTLSSAASINSTTISLPISVIPEFYQIDTEMVRVVSVSGTGPYTATLAAGLTIAHSSGAPVKSVPKRVRIVPGKPAGTPVAPSTNWVTVDQPGLDLGDGGYMVIAEVRINDGSGSLNSITDKRVFTNASGGIVPVKDWNSATGLPIATPIFEQTTSRVGVVTSAGAQLIHPGVMRYHGQSGVAIAGASPASPFSKVELLVQTANLVVELNTQGDATLVFPVPFPNGVLHISLVNGDINARVGCVVELFPNTATLSQCGFRVYMQSSGTAPAGPFRVHAMILGW